MPGTRIDKWLWAARFFKTRALATKACDLSRVSSNGQSAKPSREVRIGDQLQVKTERGDFGIEILDLSDVRGPAAAAQKLYRETEASLAARKQADEARKLLPYFETVGEGRPSKRDRRDLNRIRGRG